jgi:ABC-type Zn uptake system ZnuABC Zn-binding protein ZnuA
LLAISGISNSYSIKTDNSAESLDSLNIVTTISVIEDLARQISGSLNEISSLVSGQEDPHTFTPKPSDIEKVSSADLFIIIGISDFDGAWSQTILDEDPSIPVLSLIDLTTDGEYDPLINDINPHLWMSAKFVNSTILERIFSKLVEIDPTHQAQYTTNLNTYRSQLSGVFDNIATNLSSLNGMKVIEHHPAFKYLLDDLNVTRIGVIEDKEGSEPSASHIEDLINAINDEDGNVVLIQSPQLENDTLFQLARDTGAKISYLTPLLGVYGIDSYIKMINFNIDSLKNPIDVPDSGSVPGFNVQVIIPLLFSIATITILRRKKTQ